MDIKTAPISDLKAAVYDRLALIERSQKEIKLLNDEIEHRSQQPVTTEVKKEEPKKKDK